MTHVDDFIMSSGDDYARWMLNHFRLPAMLRMAFNQFMAKHKLFCTYEDKRYRVTGASRLGDIWLTTNFNQVNGYEKRVDVAACSDWSDQPEHKPTGGD